MQNFKPITVGIDATNLRGGGGVTHLVEFLRAAQPELYGVQRVVVWGGRLTLMAIDEKPWLSKSNPSALDQGLLKRTFWQRFHLSRAAFKEGCDLIFVPGGSYAGSFQPVVVMSQNLLPFEMIEMRRYGITFFTLKLFLLRITQLHSFRKANGIIFLTKYALEVVLRLTGKLHGETCIVPHGLNARFSSPPKIQKAINNYDDKNPYRILYVSVVDQYKHQWNVVEAIAILRQQGKPVELHLIGSAYEPAMDRLNEVIARFDIDKHWVRYHGAIPFQELHHHYSNADLGLFASSCENMPNILLETMASGLPIACSNRGPMPEMLERAGLYFNPENPHEIAKAVCELIDSPQLRSQLAKLSYQISQKYSWQRCADETFLFLKKVATEYIRKK
jgi:glycosyltransferase involved in cell wall biosynthesis